MRCTLRKAVSILVVVAFMAAQISFASGSSNVNTPRNVIDLGPAFSDFTHEKTNEEKAPDKKKVRHGLPTAENAAGQAGAAPNGKQEYEKIEGMPKTLPLDKSHDGIVPDSFVVKYKSNVSKSRMNSITESLSADSIQTDDQFLFSKITISDGNKIQSAMDGLKQNSDVEYVEPLYYRSASEANDEFYSKKLQWGLQAIDAPAKWNTVNSQDLSGITIAVIDSGVDLEHPDLAQNIVPGYDFVNSDSVPDDDFGHGTHVAGIAAAVPNNGIGVAGVAGGAKIMPVKVLNSLGYGTSLDVMNGVLYAVNHGADIINLSLGGSLPSRIEEEVIQYARSKGVTIIAATGNYRGPVSFPAAYPGVIGVGAVDWTGSAFELAKFSNFGPEVDVVAPGVGIISTIPVEIDNVTSALGDSVKDGYAMASGTSMAAPYVAGLAALVLAGNNELSCDQIQSELQGTAVDLGAPGKDDLYGYGIINGNGGTAVTHVDFPNLKLDIGGFIPGIEFVLNTQGSQNTLDSDGQGTFSLYMGQFDFNNFQWITTPEKVADIEVVNGVGSAVVDITQAGKYRLFVQGNGSYFDSNYFGIEIIIHSQQYHTISGSISLPSVDSQYPVGRGFVEVLKDGSYLGRIDMGSIGNYSAEYTIKVPIGSGYQVRYFIDTYGSEDMYSYVGYGYYDSGNTVISSQVSQNSYLDLSSEDKTGINLTIIPLDDSLPADDYTNNIGSSNVHEIASGDITNGTLNYAGDFDCFKFTAPGDGDYAIRTLSNTDTMGYLYDENFQLIDANDDGWDMDFNVHASLAAGESVYVLVKGFLDSIGEYGLKVCTDDHPNEIYSESVQGLPFGVSTNGMLDYEDDVDCFSFTIGEEGFYTIAATGDTNTDGSLYNSTYEMVASNKDGWTDNNFNITRFLTPGTYYVKVNGYFGDMGAYALKVDNATIFHGTVSLPDNQTAAQDIYLSISAGIFYFTTQNPIEFAMDNIYSAGVTIPAGSNSAEFWLPVQSSEGYQLRCSINTPGLDNYVQTSYYKQGTLVPDVRDVSTVTTAETEAGIDVVIPKVANMPDDYSNTAAGGNIGILQLDVEKAGRIDYSNDADYYKFTVEEPGYYTIYSDLAFGTGCLYDSNLNWLTYNRGEYGYYWGINFTQNLAPGTYYLRINQPHGFVLNYNVLVSGNIYAPVASNVNISGIPDVGRTLVGRYTYSDLDGDAEAGTAFRWLRSDTIDGLFVPIEGATDINYTLTAQDQNKYIKFEVSPSNNVVPFNGIPVLSDAVGPAGSADVYITASRDAYPGAAVTVAQSSQTAGTQVINGLGTDANGVAVTIKSVGANLADYLGTDGKSKKTNNTAADITGSIVVAFNKAPGAEQTKTISVTYTHNAPPPPPPASTGGGYVAPPPAPGPTPINGVLEIDPVKENNIGRANINNDTYNALLNSATATNGSKNLTINVDDAGLKEYDTQLPASAFTSSTGNVRTTINTAIASITFTSDMFENANLQGAKNIGINIAAVDKAALPAGMASVVGNSPIIEINATVDGTVTPWSNPDAPVTISIPYILENGKSGDIVTAYYLDGAGNLVNMQGSYDPVTKTVNFTTTHFSKYIVKENKVVFTDLAGFESYTKYIESMAAKGIIVGVGNNKFAPGKELTRAQFAVLLVKMLKLDTRNTKNVFTDVKSTDQYAPYIYAAYKAGLILGVGADKFNPNAAITKQDAASILARAMKYKGTIVTAQPMTGITDSDTVSSFAADAVSFTVAKGIIPLDDKGNFNAKSTVNRALAAKYIYNLFYYR